tara:strand:+ start:366 stop:872 length:507 start_codon:yes stop_codon:yes gene_type:complete
MTKPSLIEFHPDALQVLYRDLFVDHPNEGCALLIGDQSDLLTEKASPILRITVIWPCCNIWSSHFAGSKIFQDRLENFSLRDASRRNRFLIDPREQIHAQKWSRDRNLYVFGSAHSHPKGPLIPSKMDKAIASKGSLMIIANEALDMRVWWFANEEGWLPQEVAYVSG